MPDFDAKNLSDPDEVIRMSGVEMNVVDLGDLTVARAIHQPGWRWSTHIKPQVGGEWCQVRHVGVVVSGRLGVQFPDGTSYELEADDVYEIPPGHDGYTIGHEAVVMLEWTGIRAFAGFMGDSHNRMLATVLVTRFVNSAARASELGTAAWRELLSELFEAVRARFERFNGKEISTSGEGTLAAFNSPAQAVRCAGEIRSLARQRGLTMCAGIHIGEVEVVKDDLRGAVVHETERISQVASNEEILVSDTMRALASMEGLRFEDRGAQALEGLSGDWHLYSYAAEGDSAAS